MLIKESLAQLITLTTHLSLEFDEVQSNTTTQSSQIQREGENLEQKLFPILSRQQVKFNGMVWLAWAFIHHLVHFNENGMVMFPVANPRPLHVLTFMWIFYAISILNQKKKKNFNGLEFETDLGGLKSKS